MITPDPTHAVGAGGAVERVACRRGRRDALERRHNRRVDEHEQHAQDDEQNAEHGSIPPV